MHAAFKLLLLVPLAAVSCGGGDTGCGAVGCNLSTLIHVRRENGQPFVLGISLTLRVEASTSLVELHCTIQRPLDCTQTGNGKTVVFVYLATPAAGSGTDLDEVDLRWEDNAYPSHATFTILAGAAISTKDFVPPTPPPPQSSCAACPLPSDFEAKIAF